jgi:dermatan 4-sulfotransferase 1
MVISEFRQLRINKTCPRLQKEIPAELAFKPSYEEMYVDETRRYIYCLVSKASCTSWKRTLFKMADNSTVNNFTNGNSELGFKLVHDRAFSDKILRRLSNYTSEEIQYRLNNYYKFMFVREPLERLVSAYRDKMFRDDEYVPMFAPVIIKKYRHSNQTDSSK